MQVNQAAIETAGNETASVAREPILTEREETTQQNEAPLLQVISDLKIDYSHELVHGMRVLIFFM
jgi:hypothetical protein